jgi:hypothetical protein
MSATDDDTGSTLDVSDSCASAASGAGADEARRGGRGEA